MQASYECYFQWCKCSSWSSASFHAEDFYGWSGRTSETRLQHLPSTRALSTRMFQLLMCLLCVFVLNYSGIWLGPAAKAIHDHIALSPLFSPDEGWSMRPCCVENTFSKEKIWFWNSRPTYPPFGQPVEIPKNQKKERAVWLFLKVLKSYLLPITFILSQRVKIFAIKHFRLMSWFGEKIPGNPGREFKNCPLDCIRHTLSCFK